ncbi:DUF4349 domain-containing protein [Parasphingopyxis sp.]|uniref:DUF4349 domain-containing protein n=1 Tax=Parasphingopyxis sp. TaxID=1920299 RepID=UPI00260BC794|nr:DUF4349 domain-containing protein [Parasphingopyxis sp.]
MRKKFAVLGVLGVLAACGEASQYADESASADRVAPNIDPTAAPGVAFDYAMRLGVPDSLIAELQESHADSCEEMGLDRCQIIGMQFDRSDEGRVRGSLTFLIVPAEARSFAGDAVSSAEEMGGTLLSSRFSGEEVQTAIDDSERSETRIEDRLAEIDRALNAGGLSDDRRAQLESEAADLRARLAGEQQVQAANERRLAMSPLTISYVGEYSYGRKPLGQIADEGLQAGRTSLTALFTVLVYLVTVLLPWLVVGGLLIFGLRWLSNRFGEWRARREAIRYADEEADQM